MFVFDYSKHKSTPDDTVCRPQHRCLGHTEQGYGLAWSPLTTGRLLSGSDDATVCMWDVAEAGLEVQALQIKRGHTAVVEDVAWHNHHAHLFASVGDDKQLLVWDARDSSDAPSKRVEQAHKGDINCVTFNPFSEFLLATGSTDATVALWDRRNMKQKMHSFEGHKGGVYQLDWAPFSETILASCSSDRRVHVWDVSRIGQEQTPEDAEDGPPELLFIHSGHTAKVSDFQWNRNEEWAAATVSEDNILQIWQMVSCCCSCCCLCITFVVMGKTEVCWCPTVVYILLLTNNSQIPVLPNMFQSEGIYNEGDDDDEDDEEEEDVEGEVVDLEGDDDEEDLEGTTAANTAANTVSGSCFFTLLLATCFSFCSSYHSNNLQDANTRKRQKQ